jgi:hypothetical protein
MAGRFAFMLVLAAVAVAAAGCQTDPPPAPPATPPAAVDPADAERLIGNWLAAQQDGNASGSGLVPSFEESDWPPYAVSTYDQALAALAFCLLGRADRAARVLDFFAGPAAAAELAAALAEGRPAGLFFQFRDPAGRPAAGAARWMGDNAWLLRAFQVYRECVGAAIDPARAAAYAAAEAALEAGLRALQADPAGADRTVAGGLRAGYDAAGVRLDYQVTEGNIDAYAAVPNPGDGSGGLDAFHAGILAWLGDPERWDDANGHLLARRGFTVPGYPAAAFQDALDCIAWAYLAFDGYPEASLARAASLFAAGQTAWYSGLAVRGVAFDTQSEGVAPEASAGLAAAYAAAAARTVAAGDAAAAAAYAARAAALLAQLDRALLPSPTRPDAAGLAYVANLGADGQPATSFGGDMMTVLAHDRPWISGSVWYLFARRAYNPFAAAKARPIPAGAAPWRP